MQHQNGWLYPGYWALWVKARDVAMFLERRGYRTYTRIPLISLKQAARLGELGQVPVGLIVDSPWLPGYAGMDTRDYFLFPDKWLEVNLGLLERFPDAAWIPGFWVEYGMAAEPSAFGTKMHF